MTKTKVCEHWFHAICQGMSNDDIQKWAKVSGDYLCTSCRRDDAEFDYLRGITRLELVYK
ncbi:hypothetical protein ACF0H5_015590 [Mactra antiquata]